MTRRFTWISVILLVASYAGFMVKTNGRLTFLDDEGMLVTTANIPTRARLHLFINGTGEHLHPPLSDILLHEWMRATHHSVKWLRVFSLIFYIAGLLVLARCALLMGNTISMWAVLLLGTLWPFGYFYARITGWYSCSFFLIAAVTHCYELLLRHSSWRRWAAFTTLTILLLWTNYFGLVAIGLLLADLLLFHREAARKNIRPLLSAIAVMGICFLPLVRALLADTHRSDQTAPLPWFGAAMKVGFMLYSALASVAVAPWYFPWSVPIGLASLTLFIVIARQSVARLYLFYYVLLIIGLQEQHILDLKRILFVTPWLLLSIALSCSTANKRDKWIASIATGIILAIGWLGIATGWHPATSNFYEPWAKVASQSAADARHGSVIISDSSPYFFYLNYSLGLNSVPGRRTYLGQPTYKRLADVSVFDQEIAPELATSFRSVTLVSGVDVEPAMLKQSVILAALLRSCQLVSEQHSTPDPALDYKRAIDPGVSLAPYRVSVRHFDCAAGAVRSQNMN